MIKVLYRLKVQETFQHNKENLQVFSIHYTNIQKIWSISLKSGIKDYTLYFIFNIVLNP